MTRTSLPILAPPKARKRERYAPTMPRPALKRLVARLMGVKSLSGAARMLGGLDPGGHWSLYMNRLGAGLGAIAAHHNEFRTPFPVFNLKGNEKLPFAAFSALPEVTCPGAGECLGYCYSFTAWRYPGAWCRQVMNTLLLRHAPHVVAHWFAQLDDGITVRLYVDGDFDSAQTIDFWFSLLKSRPDIRAYGYSKSWRLLWEYAQNNELPANYRLNLSSGGKDQGITLAQMMNLSITRGQFIAVPVSYRPTVKRRGKVGFERYGDPAYHKAVRASAVKTGVGRMFSCPGKCGECAGGEHACGSDRFKGVSVVIGVH